MKSGVLCAAVLVSAWMLTACGAPTPTSQETPAVRPAVPDGWRVITSDREDIILPVPPALVILNTSGSIGGLREADGRHEELIVSATGPRRVDQRQPGESVEDWLTRGNWLTAGRGEPIATTYREVLLPAGSTLEVTAGYRFEDEDRWTMLHVIDTGQGYAVLQFDGGGPKPETAPEEIRLMRELVEYQP
jgi:hypothetical protein